MHMDTDARHVNPVFISQRILDHLLEAYCIQSTNTGHYHLESWRGSIASMVQIVRKIEEEDTGI